MIFFQFTRLAVDQIGHYLYWSESSAIHSSSQKTSSSRQATLVYRISLYYPLANHSPSKVLELPDNKMIEMMEVSPQNNHLYFTSRSTEGAATLNRINLSQLGENPEKVLEENIIYKSLQKKKHANLYCYNEPNFKKGLISPEFSISYQEGIQKFLLRRPGSGFFFVIDENFCKHEGFGVGEYSMVMYRALSQSIKYTSPEWRTHVKPKLRNILLNKTLVTDVFDPLIIKLERERLSRSCVIPGMISSLENEFKVIHKTENSLRITVPNFHQNESCSNILSQNIFTLFYTLNEERDFNDDSMENVANNETSVKTFSIEPNNYFNSSTFPTITLNELKPYSTYKIQIKAKNAYGALRFLRSNPSSNELASHEVVEIVSRTAEGKPSEPRNVSAVVLSPEDVLIKWLPSLISNGKSVQYKIRWAYSNPDAESEFSETVDHHSFPLNDTDLEGTENYLYHILGSKENGPKLLPNRKYKVWVTANTEHPKDSRSKEITFSTFEQPNLVTIPKEHLKPRTMIVDWVSPKESNILKHEINIMPLEEYENELISDTYSDASSSILGFKSLSTNRTQPLQKYLYNFNDLSPGTTYVVFVQLTYRLQNSIPSLNPLSSEIDRKLHGKTTRHYEYQWPRDDRQVVSTPPDKPLTPGPPYDEIIDGIPYLR